MKLELAILAGAESKAFLVDFKTQIDRLEKIMTGRSIKDIENESQIPEETFDDAEDDDFSSKPAKNVKQSKASSFDDEESDEVEELNFTEAPKEKKKRAPKAKKITIDDVNDACKARAAAGGKNGRKEVLKMLKDNFDTESVSDLTEDQYAQCVDLMAVKA